jgi:beta-glucosidase
VNGHPLTINWANRNVNGILETWFSNAMVGKAVAATLFGDNNPGGKLPVTVPKSVGQIEFNFPYKPNSQIDEPEKGKGYAQTQVNGALYPFGFGLSYTSFAYSNLQVSPAKQNSQGEVQVNVDITNSGNYKGDEVVQLYLKQMVNSVTNYLYDLRGFERITLEKGETKTVHFVLRPGDLEIIDKNGNRTVEPGTFEIMIGSSSEDIRLRKTFDITYE